MDYFETIKSISEGLIESDKEIINLDKQKDSVNELKKFRSTDGFEYKDNKIILYEFKRCNLFYQKSLTEKETDIVNGITTETPEKLIDSVLVLIPKFITDFRKNDKYKVKFILVLGENVEDARIEARLREGKLAKTPQLIKLENKLNKYRETPFIITSGTINRITAFIFSVFSNGNRFIFK